MEVILSDDIDKLGSRGHVVRVADGYARNYLLPRRLAVPATAANKKIVDQERDAHLRREATATAEAADLAKLMEGLVLTIAHKAGEQEQLFGSVTAQNIVDALAAEDFTVDRRKVHLDDPIKQLGEYKVTLRLHRDVSVEIGVNVVPEGGNAVPEGGDAVPEGDNAVPEGDNVEPEEEPAE